MKRQIKYFKSKYRKDYKGKKITEDEIAKIKQIATRYDDLVYKEYYKDLLDVSDLYYLYGSEKVKKLILGEDWFICYELSENAITILDWVALENKENRFVQIKEMFIEMKKLLLNCNKLNVEACVRHGESYELYKKALKKGIEQGYFKEWYDYAEFDINYHTPKEIVSLDYECRKQDVSLEDLLYNDKIKEYAEYYGFILHDICFSLTDKFYEEYQGGKIKTIQ